MKKPERYDGQYINYEENNFESGYNKGCEDREKFLPSEDELYQIIKNIKNQWLKDYPSVKHDESRTIAKELAKRIGV